MEEGRLAGCVCPFLVPRLRVPAALARLRTFCSPFPPLSSSSSAQSAYVEAETIKRQEALLFEEERREQEEQERQAARAEVSAPLGPGSCA